MRKWYLSRIVCFISIQAWRTVRIPAIPGPFISNLEKTVSKDIEESKEMISSYLSEWNGVRLKSPLPMAFIPCAIRTMYK